MDGENRGEGRLAGVSVLAFTASLAVIAISSLVGDRPIHWLPAVFLAMALVAAESMGEEMPDGGRSTYGMAVLFSAMAALSLPGAMAVALFSGVRVNPRPHRRDWPKIIYDGATSSLSMGICSFAYHLLGGTSTVFTLGGAAKSIGPLLASIILYWGLNTASVALGLYLLKGVKPRDFVLRGAVPLLPAQVVFGLAGWGLGIVFAQNAFHLVGSEVVGTVAEALRGFFAVAVALVLLGVIWHFSGKNVGLLETYDESLRLLVDYLEKREPYLNDHSGRVMNYALLLGRKLNLPLYELRKLGHAALLHDIGRAAVPLEVLAREGVITDDEFEEVKRHPLVGASWLEEVEYLSDIADAVRHHHEYYDGGGYVDHLRGETIPLGARILALADAYEAMLKDRPYRERKGREEAAAELLQNAGKQFDPRLVELFLEALVESGLLPAGVVVEFPVEVPREAVSAPSTGRMEGGEVISREWERGRPMGLGEASREAEDEAEQRKVPPREERREPEPAYPAETARTAESFEAGVRSAGRGEGARGIRGKGEIGAPYEEKPSRRLFTFGSGRRKREEMIRQRREAREKWKQQVLKELSEEWQERESPPGGGEEDEGGG
ncbi:MAG: HD domain-containing phosphohydrolase [Candidatus Geothermincolales bacterium]